MYSLGLIATLTILFVDLWGVALLAGWFWRNRWFAVATGPWLFVTAVYAIENHHGLGQLRGFGAVATVVAAALIGLSACEWEPRNLGSKQRRG